MRTTDEAVGGIIDVDSGDDLTPFILSANELVTEICVPAGYTEQRLELIERWLAAHFYAIFNQSNAIQSEKTGPVSASYMSNIGRVLQYTRWGQQVLALDTKGGLAALSKSAEEGKKIPLGLTYLGTNCSQ